MSTELIAQDLWADFLDSFSLKHDRWRVTVEVLDPSFGAQAETVGMPLSGISYEPSSGEVIVWFGGESERHLGHVIAGAREIWLLTSDSGADEVLEIVSDGGATLIRFESPMPVEMVDGVVR